MIDADDVLLSAEEVDVSEGGGVMSETVSTVFLCVGSGGWWKGHSFFLLFTITRWRERRRGADEN